MKIKQSLNNKFVIIFSIYKNIAHHLIPIKNFILQHIEDHFFETIWITIQYKSISLIYSEIDLITDVFEIFQWDVFVLDWFHIRETFYKIKVLLSSYLSQSRIWRFLQQVKYNCQTVKWDFCLSESFQIESIQIKKINEHRTSQTYKRSVRALILDCQDHYN